MFKFDAYNRPEPDTFYLCEPDGTLLCELNGIDPDSAEMKITLNNQYELSFDYDRWVNTLDGELVESNGYFDLTVEMRIFVKSFGYFVLKYPPYEYDGDREKKSVTAYSCECELEKKDLVGFKINTGETDSLEYLVVYDDDETEELLNGYTGLPYDYIMFDNTYPAQLQELYGKYKNGATITDPDQIADIKSYSDLIARLKSRLIPETIIDEDGDEYDDYRLVEFLEYTYDDDGNVVSVYLFPADSKDEYQVGFNGRIQQLIEFYTKYHDQLSLVPLAIEKCSCNWTVGEIDPSLANKKFQFNVDSENIYSFLTNDVASVANCVFTFELFNKEVNAILVENIGEDSGVVLARESLLNTVQVSCDDDNLFTRYNVSGADDLTITQVNFGSSRIDDLTYFLNVRDDNGKRIYVTDELAAKYYQFAEDREIARDSYVNYTTNYNQLLIDIDELKYRVPNDIVQTDWDTFTLVELEEALKTYKNLLATLVSLYKEDYGSAGVNSDGSVKEQFIKDTMYWYDYYAYQEAIAQIEAAYEAKARNETYADIDNKETLAEIKAWETEWSLYGTVELQNKIDAYNNQMKVLIDSGAVVTKYPPRNSYNGVCVTQGTDELKQISIDADKPSNLNGVIFSVDFSFKHSRQNGVYFEFYWNDGTVSTQSVSAASNQQWTWFAGDTLYFKFTANNIDSIELIENTGEIYSWDEIDVNSGVLSDLTYDERVEYCTEYMYMQINYHDEEYMEAYNLRNECQEYLDTLLVELEDLQDQLQQAQADRTALVNLTTIEGYNRTELGKLVSLNGSSAYNTFTEKEIQTISMLYMDVDYNNENILTTSLDTVVSAIDAQLELLEDAREQLSIASQPQIEFTAEIDNLLAMAEFRDFDFTVGNYTVVEYYDDYMVKLRLYEMTYNPCVPEGDLHVTFTNFIRSRSERSDLSYILERASGGGSGGGGSGSGTTYGADIDATISDTMLAQLLNSETFGTRVSNIILDTIDVNSLYSRTATFGGLGNGFTTIKGDCIKTGYIVSNNYNGSVTKNSNDVVTKRDMTGTVGSIIDMETGRFNFGGMSLYFDGTDLYIHGKISWNDIYSSTDSDDSLSLMDYLKSIYVDWIDFNDLVTQVDEKIETWYQTDDPSLEWTDAEKALHVGDIWCAVATESGENDHTYIWVEVSDGNYKWVEVDNVPDELIDKVDGKACIYTSQPVPPYDVNDLWITTNTDETINSVYGEIYVCVIGRKENEEYDLTTDWKISNYYSEKTSYVQEILTSQIDEKIETWYQTDDPSLEWTDAEKALHVGDIWCAVADSSGENDHTYMWTKVSENTYAWMEIDNVPDELIDKVDGKACIYTSQPVPPYYVNDLWITTNTDETLNSTFGEIYVCTTTRESGDFDSSDWVISNNYTEQETFLRSVLGMEYSEIADEYIFSPNLVGCNLFVGDSTGVHCSIDGETGVLEAQGVNVSGEITAEKGKIGNWYITDSRIQSSETISIGQSGTQEAGLMLINEDSNTSTDGTDKPYIVAQAAGGTAMFRVDRDGSVYVNGTITAGSGSKIGPWTITDTYMQNNGVTSVTNTSTSGVYLGTDGLNISGGSTATTAYITKNRVNIGGQLTWDGSTLNVNGVINAGSGSTIGGWTITGGKIYGGTEGSNGTGVAVMQSPSDNITNVFAAGGTSHENYSDCPFRVTKKGALYAQNACIIDNLYFGTYNVLTNESEITKCITFDNLTWGLQFLTNIEVGRLYVTDLLYVVGSDVLFNNLTVDGQAYINQLGVDDRLYFEVNSRSYDDPLTISPNVSVNTTPNDAGYCVVARTTGSSIKYKNVIRNLSNSDINSLYDIPVVWFQYKEDYLSPEDERYGKNIPGFITEDWENILPIAVDHSDGEPEIWNSHIVIPLMFEMIKNNHAQIDYMQSQLDSMQSQLDAVYDEIAELKKETEKG